MRRPVSPHQGGPVHVRPWPIKGRFGSFPDGADSQDRWDGHTGRGALPWGLYGVFYSPTPSHPCFYGHSVGIYAGRGAVCLLCCFSFVRPDSFGCENACPDQEFSGFGLSTSSNLIVAIKTNCHRSGRSAGPYR